MSDKSRKVWYQMSAHFGVSLLVPKCLGSEVYVHLSGMSEICIVCAVYKMGTLISCVVRGVNTFSDQCSVIGRTDIVE